MWIPAVAGMAFKPSMQVRLPKPTALSLVLAADEHLMRSMSRTRGSAAFLFLRELFLAVSQGSSPSVLCKRFPIPFPYTGRHSSLKFDLIVSDPGQPLDILMENIFEFSLNVQVTLCEQDPGLLDDPAPIREVLLSSLRMFNAMPQPLAWNRSQ
jgi:hypothetical protein